MVGRWWAGGRTVVGRWPDGGGGIATGVLIGYPFGGVLYDFREVSGLELETELI